MRRLRRPGRGDRGRAWILLWALGVCLGLLGVFGIIDPGQADVLQDLGATYQTAAEQLAAAFPKVEVQIVAVTGDSVRVEGVGVASLRPGLELTLFRRGEVFRHPTTHQVLGHTEQALGTLVVTAVEPDGATGRLVPVAGRPGPAPAPGDGARITAGRLPVAVLPTSGVQAAFDSTDQTQLLLVARFSAILDKTGRFLSVDPQRVLDLVGPTQTSNLSALEVARRFGGAAVVSSRIVREGKTRVLETMWVSGQTGETLVALRSPVTPASFPPRFAWEETPELERQYPLDGPVRALALGDLDGDGRAELVVADEQSLTAYRTVEGGNPTPVDGSAFRVGGLVLSVDIAPLTGTNRAQLVVVDQRTDAGRGGVRARVLEWSASTGFRVLHETAGHYLRVARVGSEDWLLEQDAGDDEPFDTGIRRLRWDGDRFRDASSLRVPRGVSIYGLALMRLTGSAEPEVVAFTDDFKLNVWTARGQRLWTSADPLGGSAVTFEYLPSGAAGKKAGGDTFVGRIAGRVVPLPGSIPEILVYENLLPALQQGRGIIPRLAATLFNRGRMHRLRWKEGAFVRVWQSTTTDGYVADFAYGDLDGDGLPEVVVAVVPRGFDLDTLNPLGRPKGRLLVYELP
jgi:hypothetical protein